MNIRIRSNVPHQLSIQLVPMAEWLLASLGVLFICLGLFIVYLLGWVVTIDIHDGVIEHKQSLLGLVWHQSMRLPLNTIEGFETQVRRNSGLATMAVVMEKTNGNRQDLRVGDMSGDEKQAWVDQMNKALATGTSLHYSSDRGQALVGGLFFGGFISAIGLLCLFFLQTISIIGDRDSDKICVYKRRRLFPLRLAPAECIAISEFSHVSSSKFTMRSASSPSATSLFVALETKDGKSLPLAVGPMFTEESSEKISQIITTWVNKNHSPSSRKSTTSRKRFKAR